MTKENLTFRHCLVPGDAKTVRDITKSTGFFTAEEVNIAEELATEHLTQGDMRSGYYFITAHIGNTIVAYSCYGPIPGSDYSYDLYWIVTHAEFRNLGYGKKLLQETERAAILAGAQGLYAETSSTRGYTPTRAFYEHNGYQKEAILKDFYRLGDDKVFYSKKLN